jgi:hypothetical protein
LNDTYLETFTNEYHEDWWFDYNKENNMGILWGNDSLIFGDTFYIFDGRHPTLILNDQEKEWLDNTWNKHSKHKDVYLDCKATVEFNEYHTYLKNNYCPICLKQRKQFESHHCVPAAIGGSDDYVNKLVICNSCHRLITNGCEEDSNPRHLTAIYHQIYIFGIDFYKMNPKNNSRFGNKDMGLYKNVPHMKELLDEYEKLNDNKKVELNNKFKNEALYYYKYNRSIVGEIIPNSTN